MRRRLLDLALAAAILAVLALVVARGFSPPVATVQGAARIADGDSLTIADERIRLKGIDAPELAQTCMRGGEEWPCGRRARDRLAQLAAGRAVSCEADGRDRYGRLLARCAVDGLDLGRAMVEEGWALAYGDYEVAEVVARSAGVGLWSGAFERPQDWRHIHGGLAEDADGGLADWLRAIWQNLAGH